MATTAVITIVDTRGVTDLKTDLAVTGGGQKALIRLSRYLGRLALKTKRASMAVQVQNGDGVQASVTVTAASVQAADTVTINGITLTATAGSTSTTAFHIGVSDTADALALKTCINSNTTLNKSVIATSALGVCTVKALTAGAFGKGYTAASSNGTRLAVSASPFQNGSDDTATTTTLHYGL